MLVLGNSLFHLVLVLRLLYEPEVEVLTFSYVPMSLEGLLKHRFLGPTLRISAPVGLGWGLRMAFVASSHALLKLLFQEPHFENSRNLKIT